MQGEDWPGWAAKFLQVFAESGNVSLAARACGIDRTTPYALRQRDEGFAAMWQEAQDAAVDALEARARQLALEGNTTLLMFLLRAHRPERYRERVDVKLDLRHEAERVAERLGISPEEVLARAERLVRGER
ncbi:MAG TPA: hypothetical protein VIH37_06460 [Candidatus Limnocylindrales bacterium]